MQNKEKQLTIKDYEKITDLAIDKCQQSSTYAGDRSYLTRCYVGAFMEYLNKNNLEVKSGKIYESS